MDDELQLQCLPAPAAVVNARPVLRMDDVVVTVLAAWPLCCEMFEGEGPVNGPVPLIFAEDPEAARTALDREKDEFGLDLNHFMKRYDKKKIAKFTL
jgi:hypothetical protein